MAESEAAAAAVVSAEEPPALTEPVEAPAGEALDHKRKLGDLGPDELGEAPSKKQEVSSPAPADETPAPAADPAAEAGPNDPQSAGPQEDEIAAPPSDTIAADLVIPDGEIDGGSGVHAAETHTVTADVVGSDGMQSTVLQEIDAGLTSVATATAAADVKVGPEQMFLDGKTDDFAADGGQKVQKLEDLQMGNGQDPSAENTQHAPTESLQKPTTLISQRGSLPTTGQQLPTSSRKIEVPSNKVGVLIGKAGDTIRFLQFNSGAKIQITRDAEADPNSSTRPVELMGTPESINKAEKLIKDVIAEADAGGSPSLVARGFGTVQSGGEHIDIQVPNEKVGTIIGKGGETIKNLQTRCGARIQLIPQHLPAGDASKERTVRVTGNKKQIESARELIKEVMNQAPVRSSPLSGGYSQQSFRPRGPTTLPQWPPRAAAPTQPVMGYDYQQRGTSYPPQSTQYPSQPYGGYSQQPPPRSNLSSGWDQRQAAPTQAPSQAGAYDYYGQGGPATDIQSSNSMSTPAPSSTPAPVNYNYGQSQAPGYGHPAYAQSAPTQQNYGHGYNEPKYDNQAPSQQIYGQQPLNAQTGVYAQQTSTPQSNYSQQQPYSKQAYGVPTQEVPQSYGPSRASQPGDPMYQGPAPSSYGSSVPSQPTPAYNQTYGTASGTVDGYTQPSSAGYPQHGGQAAPGYGQGGQPVPAYTQPSAQSGGYGQYPTSQPNYGDQPATGNVNYGYQGGSADMGYSNSGYGSSVPSSGYGAPPVVNGQPGYVQPLQSNPSVYYEQSIPPQSGYGSMPGSAPAGYTKSLSPQPGYGGQYDSVQMYGHH